MEITNQPQAPTWTFAGWAEETIDEVPNAYVFYAGNLHDAENQLISFDLELKFTPKENYTLTHINGDELASPIESDDSHTESLGVSASTSPSISFTIADSGEEESEGEIHFLAVVIEPDANMAGVIGEEVPSIQEDSAVKHFVTPKKTDDLNQEFVDLKAAGIDAETFNKFLEWEGGEAGSTGEKRKVKRDDTGKTEIKIRIKDGGEMVSCSNVWVVWAIMTARITGDQLSPNNDLDFNDFMNFDKLGYHYDSTEYSDVDITFYDDETPPTFRPFTTTQSYFTTGIEWKSLIQPSEIFNKNSDIPDLTEILPEDPVVTDDGGSAYYSHWDIRRDVKKQFFKDGTLSFQDHDWVIDDAVHGTRDENPYANNYCGELFSVDGPGINLTKKEYDDGEIIYNIATDLNSKEKKYVFKEWTRLKINDTWYVISNKMDWNASVKISKENIWDWQYESHSLGTGNP